MSTIYNLPNFREKYFEYKNLDKIHGQPTIDTIAKLLRQTKRNAQRVPTVLGGGQFGYLALVINTHSYNSIPGSACFIRPLDPGTFTPTHPIGIRAAPLTAADIATQKINFDERKRQYNECQGVEMALRNQVVEAIEEEYLQPLRNNITDMITSTIPVIFGFLQLNYGNLSPSELKERERTLDDMIYDPSQNVDSIFNKIQEFQDMCTLISNEKTDTQLVTYAYLCFQKTGIFQTSLKEWNTRTQPQKTFALFKIFMRKEYRDLQAVGGLTIQNSSLNLMKEFKEYHENMNNTLREDIQNSLHETVKALNVISQNQTNVNPSTTDYEYPYQNSTYEHSTPNGYVLPVESEADNNMANNVSNNQEIAQLLREMQEMKNTIKNLTLTNQQTKNKQVKKERNNVNPKNGLPWKRYCWSCGCCDHWGRNCPTKKTGHKNEATF